MLWPIAVELCRPCVALDTLQSFGCGFLGFCPVFLCLLSSALGLLWRPIYLSTYPTRVAHRAWIMYSAGDEGWVVGVRSVASGLRVPVAIWTGAETSSPQACGTPHNNGPGTKTEEESPQHGQGSPDTRGMTSFTRMDAAPRCGLLARPLLAPPPAKGAGGWEKKKKKRCKQKLRRGSTSVCKGGAQEHCNRTWEFIQCSGLALP